MTKQIKNIEQLEDFAKEITKFCANDIYILLSGDLGAGKTTFTKKLLKLIGVKENVTSPTFNIMNQYFTNDLKINHVDAYRLKNDTETEMYLEEFENSLNIIEWYNNLKINFNDKKFIKISIKIINNDKREIQIETNL